MPGTPYQPMLATAGQLPVGGGWAYEFKWDGVRAIAQISDGSLRLFARRGPEITVAYPELAGLGAAVGRDAVLDGEVAVLDEKGRPSFRSLAERMHVRDAGRAARLARSLPVTYLIFDVLALDGVEVCGRPYTERRALLADLGLVSDHWLAPPSFDDGGATVSAAREYTLEGVVAKRRTSLYRPGTRSPDWIKVKLERTGDLVVGGYRPGARALGALLVGVPGPNGLEFRGRVGGGISAASERELLAVLGPLISPSSPFAADLPREDSRGAVWVRPEIVVELKFSERTADLRLRFPRFLRLRTDKAPDEVFDE
ncbi:non-homologous end-joining DNA ligase [Virgisporangium aurantiacum]|uniref:non-homologous end-joining DNA ligase n=1 Tax=Virgisporangium aurantiacum TaxID=175570 RepID=UPI0019502458|nr:non-homologous end-joining DNA ligase [Virgisporangium aurantiacum]